ncbi:MAG: MFS transporter [Pirellulales bacterium]
MGSIRTRLSIMMFLQFFVWGAWFATLGKCLADNGLGDFGGDAYGSAPIAAIFAPLFLGLIADRFFPSQIVMGVLLLLGGVFLCLAPGYAAVGNGTMMVNLFIAHMLCYMPTLGLSNSITFSNISNQNEFPKIRVWGTIGWIIAGLAVGFQGWSGSFNIFWLAGICSFITGFYCFTLPHTPPPAKNKPVDFRTIFMVDAFRLLTDLPFLVFIVCSTLICIPLAYYYGLTSNLLGQIGFEAPASTMTLGQMSEIFFMLLIPFFFRRLGVKWMILIGMAAWVIRYLLFAYGAPDQTIWMMLLAILLHGVCYDFFFVTGFMYTDDKASTDIRGQAQSMLVFFTQGIGMYFGYWVAFSENSSTVTKYSELSDAIKAAAPQQELSFTDSLTRMFSVSLPENIDQQLLSDTMGQWKEYWIIPAVMAGVIMVAFAFLFHDKMSADSTAADNHSEASA